MTDRVETAYVELWGMLVGAVAWDRERGFATFEFDRPFLERGLDLSPLRMPLADAQRGSARFEFRTLPAGTFRGLPGMLAVWDLRRGCRIGVVLRPGDTGRCVSTLDHERLTLRKKITNAAVTTASPSPTTI